MSVFDAAEEALADALDAVFGTAVLVSPRTSASDYLGAAPDPTRPEARIVGVFDEDPGTGDIAGQSRKREMTGTTRLATPGPLLDVSAAELGRLGYALAEGDLVVLEELPGQPRYRVRLAEPLGRGLRVHLAVEGDP